MSHESLPYFQQLQLQFTAHIRNPNQHAYKPNNERRIEPRRLKVYETLFFNNIHDFFSQLFPVTKNVLGESRWKDLIREYMINHQAQTPLFHELGEEFLDFLENEFRPIEGDPVFLLELAHYEWVELALSISELESVKPIKLNTILDKPFKTELGEPDLTEANLVSIDLNVSYKLSPLAWPLAYEWPVHKISKTFQPTQKSPEITTLLVYRSEEIVKDEVIEKIDFMALTPMLYQWLIHLNETQSAKQALLLATQQQELEATLVAFAQQTLSELYALGLVLKVESV